MNDILKAVGEEGVFFLGRIWGIPLCTPQCSSFRRAVDDLNQVSIFAVYILLILAWSIIDF